jgi:glycosyltransferase involved in cell wall biosynthesis
MVRREMREYVRTTRIVVLSTFCARTFYDQGIARDRIGVLPLGVDVSAFQPPRDVIDARLCRVRRGDPLRILYVGAISYQKGLLDLARVIASVSRENFRFLLVGKVLPEARVLVGRLRAHANVTVRDKVPQATLPLQYREGDLFLFPTIQDGFGVVLAQAKASGLPIITTPNSGGPDVLRPGCDGWIVPIRDPDAIVARLRWCDANRPELAAMIGANAAQEAPRTWSDVAVDFEAICRRHAERLQPTEHSRAV